MQPTLKIVTNFRIQKLKGHIMKKMTCKQLGGACDITFSGDTFEAIVSQSKLHGMEMFQKQDTAHLQAIAEVQVLMQNPQAMQAWFAAKQKEFDALPDS